MTISKEVLDELLSGVENANDLLGDQGLMKELKVRLMERMLGAGHAGFAPRSAPSNSAMRPCASSNGDTRSPAIRRPTYPPASAAKTYPACTREWGHWRSRGRLGQNRRSLRSRLKPSRA